MQNHLFCGGGVEVVKHFREKGKDTHEINAPANLPGFTTRIEFDRTEFVKEKTQTLFTCLDKVVVTMQQN